MFDNINMQNLLDLNFKAFYKVCIFILVIGSIIVSGVLVVYIFFEETYRNTTFIKVFFLSIGISLPSYLFLVGMEVQPLIKDNLENIKKLKNKNNEIEMYLGKMDFIHELSKDNPDIIDYIVFKDGEINLKPKSVKPIKECVKDELNSKASKKKAEEIKNKVVDFIDESKVDENELKNILDKYNKILEDYPDYVSKIIYAQHEYSKEILENQKKQSEKIENKIYQTIFMEGTSLYLLQFYMSIYITLKFLSADIEKFLVVFVFLILIIKVIIKVKMKFNNSRKL